MFDRLMLPLQKRLTQPAARQLSQAGVSADLLTISGFVIGLAALPLLAMSAFVPALACIALNRLFDGLDGAVARLNTPSDRGAFLDIAFDSFFYGTIPLGFALADPASNALAGCVLLLSFIGTGSSFLAFAAVSHKRDDEPTFEGKGILYSTGLAEGAETIAFFVAMCLFPSAFRELAFIFASMCFITALMRWWAGWRLFGQI